MIKDESVNMDNRQINCLDTGEVVVGYENYMKTNHWIQIRSSIINQSSNAQHVDPLKNYICIIDTIKILETKQLPILRFCVNDAITGSII